MEIQTIQSAIAGIHRINEFFELEEKKIRNLQEEQKNDIHSPFVEFEDVSFGYDGHMVLEHMNLIVEQGEQVTLSGRTGAGDCRTYRIEGYD